MKEMGFNVFLTVTVPIVDPVEGREISGLKSVGRPLLLIARSNCAIVERRE